jgi:hypothetical protein
LSVPDLPTWRQCGRDWGQLVVQKGFAGFERHRLHVRSSFFSRVYDKVSVDVHQHKQIARFDSAQSQGSTIGAASRLEDGAKRDRASWSLHSEISQSYASIRHKQLPKNGRGSLHGVCRI